VGLTSTRVLGVRVDCLDTGGALVEVERMLEGPRFHQVATVNPEFVMRARRDSAFAAALEAADLCLADGWGVLWAARRQGCRLPDRVTGVDLIPRLAELCARRGFSVCLVGAREGVAAETARRLVRDHPGLVVAATHAGSPRPEDDAETLRLLAAAKPDLLLVAYGAPNQEIWIARLRDRLPVRVAIGVGGAFDFIAGRVPRAPGWMRRAGFEWLYRLAREPWRARRMAVLPVYALHVLRNR
jgi:N-acetylglucosaminyldiphosphoundecaprenol N-acetyl-beta-D-mannosaminyltransferase